MKGYFYNFFIHYEEYKKEIEPIGVENLLLKKIIDNRSNKELTIDDIISLSLDITKKVLSFRIEHNSNNPNVLVDNPYAHCVGYSIFFTTVCNYLIEKNKLNNNWEAIPKRGELYFLGINIHDYMGLSDFVKHHDFVCVKNLINKDERKFVDPSLYEFTLIDEINYYYD